MLAIPAIDLRRGQCVRLRQGRAEEETVYRSDPVEVAKEFVSSGAQTLHVVDLDGAFLQAGGSPNLEVIRNMRKQVDVRLQVGGGLRSEAAIQGMLGLGVDQVVVTTIALHNPTALKNMLNQFPGQIQLGADVREGVVSMVGWTEKTTYSAIDFALQWRNHGIRRVVYTDISRDGMLTGPNLEVLAAFAKSTGMRVTASGGVRHLADLDALSLLETTGVDQAIVGKAIYTGALSVLELRRHSRHVFMRGNH